MICNYIWKPKPANILNGGRCPECRKKEKTKHRLLTHEQFIEKVTPVLNSSIVIIGTYTGYKNKIECLCKKCNKKIEMTPGHLYKGYGHKVCSQLDMAKERIKPFEDVLKIIKNSSHNIEYWGGYEKSSLPVEIHCLDCNAIYSTYIYNIKKGHGCPKCNNIATGNRCRKPKNRFVNELYNINPFIKVIGDYINSYTNIKCECSLCGYIWNPRPLNLLNGKGCPSCKRMPYGELRIKNYLMDNKISFVHQKSFENLKGCGNKPLFYDFYLPKYNLLIEFQGEQHKRPVEYFGGEEKFKIQQEHDRRKREYAQQNNIDFLEIWYYEINNIKSILLQKINEIKENNLKLESVETVIST